MTTRTLPKQAVLIVNTASRRGAESYQDARSALRAAGIKLLASHAVKNPRRLQPLIRQAITDGAPMIVVGGGDGTLSSTVDEFLGTDTVFAILPLGTANSFAKSLGVPVDLDGAVEVIAHGQRRRMDLGCIDGDYFANGAAMGLSPLIAATVPHRLKHYLGMLAYLAWAVRVAFKYSPFRLIVDDGRHIHRVWATEARIAKGAYFGGIELVEDADLTSGEIIVQAVTGKHLLGLAWSWFATVFKLKGRKQTVTEFRGRKLKIDARPKQGISIDGEPGAETPVTVSVARAAVWVAAPAGS